MLYEEAFTVIFMHIKILWDSGMIFKVTNL